MTFGLAFNIGGLVFIGYLLRKISTLFDAIAHGDEKHREWLNTAIDDHFAGRPVRRP